MFVKPVSGLLVREPATKQVLPPEGKEVLDGDLFWQRRIRDGDVEIVKPVKIRRPE
ncbi:MAG: DUF2635 domain-containing protein [Pseudomonadota bacterium]|nr:DUF2635 domain-containing protein [Pseudomonadota bacterium]